MSERRGVLLAGLGVLLAAVALTVAFVARDRVFTASVPQPPPLERTDIVPVRAGASACLSGITILDTSRRALFRVGTNGRPPVPLTVVASGPGGYRSAARVAPTWRDNDLLIATFDPPPAPLHGSFCIRNDGPRTIDLYAAADRARNTLATTTVGRREQPANVQLTFLEGEEGSLREHAGAVADRITAFKPVGPWVAWVLAALLLVVPTALLVAAMVRALRDDDLR